MREPHSIGAALGLLCRGQRVLYRPAVAAVERGAGEHAGERFEIDEDDDALAVDTDERDLIRIAAARTDRR